MFWEAPPFSGGESSPGAPSPALGIHNSSTMKSFQGWVSSEFACLYRRRCFFLPVVSHQFSWGGRAMAGEKRERE